MYREKIILLGSGGHAGIVLDILNETGLYDIIGLTTKSLKKGDFFKGIPILGDDSILNEYQKKGINKIAIGVGGFTNNYLRKNIFLGLKKLGFTVVSTIHPRSIISKTAEIGEGVCVFPGAIINCGVKIGNNVIIATGSSIDHGTIIHDHVLISAGVTIGAYSEIKESALIALGAKVISDIIIGEEALVAAGAVVVKNIERNKKVFGIPAK